MRLWNSSDIPDVVLTAGDIEATYLSVNDLPQFVVIYLFLLKIIK